MKIVKNDEMCDKIEVGDLVLYRGVECIIIENSEVYVDEYTDEATATYPYIFANIHSGQVVNEFGRLDTINGSNDIKLLSKNKNIELKY